MIPKFRTIGLFIFFLAAIPKPGQAQEINPGIVLTFDDYAIANWHKLLPIFEKYHAKATFFICTPYAIPTNQYENLLDLYHAGNEIGSHSFHHYNSLHYVDTSTIDKYIANEIIPSINWFDSVFNIQLTSFSYPNGARNSSLDAALLKYFKVVRGNDYTLNSSINKIKYLSHNGLIHSVGFDLGNYFSLDQLKVAIDKCKNEKYIQVFVCHTPVENASGEYQVSYSTIDSVLHYAYNLGLNFYTVSECRLPIPLRPKGDTIINTSETLSSVFYTNQTTDNVTWKLSPDSSASVIAYENKAIMNWNEDFAGEVTLKAAYYNECGTGTFSNPLIIGVNLPIIHTTETIASTRVYPNPSNGLIQIETTTPNSEMKLYNSLGQAMMNIQNQGQFCSLQLSEKGIYYLRVITGQKSETHKIIIEK